MVGFFIKVNIHQDEDCCGMWLRLKEQGKFAQTFALHAYPLFLGGRNNRLGCRVKPLQYGMVCLGYRGIFLIWSYLELL